MKKSYYISFLLFIVTTITFSQQNEIQINATLNSEKNTLQIQQEILYFNNSNTELNSIFLHNWANSFKDRETPLSKRFIEDFRKDLYFANEKDIGYSKIKNISINFNNSIYKELENRPDILEVYLENPLKPKENVRIKITYIVKIPNAKFTGYGKNNNGYHLRYWYITPAIYKSDWQIMSNLNLDDLFEDVTTFDIKITTPSNLTLVSSLKQDLVKKQPSFEYHLYGKNKKDVILNIEKKSNFKNFNTDSHNIVTDVLEDDINDDLTKDILNREIKFLKNFLGDFPLDKVIIDKTTQGKNPVYGLTQLPDFLSPYSDIFKYDLKMFKAISKRYLEQTLLINQRTDYWLIDGLQNYLMLEYVNRFYPEIKLLGKVSNSWFLKRFNISKLNFNEKYPLIYQFTARKFLDQSLTTSADSLSNFNRKIVSKYKSGLGFTYLNGFLGEGILDKSIYNFYQQNKLNITSTKDFQETLSTNTEKDINWFFKDYLHTNKKIDYTIDDVKEEKDSLKVIIKNKRNITAPVAFYGIKNKEIKLKKWLTNIDSTKTIAVAKDEFDQLVLNYENIYPEYNTLDNWYNTEKKFFNKPFKFTLIKDVKAPNYNQLFYQPNVGYNFYDGLILGMKFHNKPLIKRNLEFRIAPAYALKSQMINGSFSILYNQFFEETSIYKISYGIAGNTLQYAPDLSYSSLNPFVDIQFKRKSLRDATSEFITAKLVSIDKEVAPTAIKTDQDSYSVLSLSYNYINPDIIKELRYNFSTEFSKDFSKAAVDFRYRKLTSSDTQLDFRVFAGTFIHNNSEGDYFSFGLDRANDYLFQLNYYGRSEDSGIFSQQFIITEGGFKSVLPTRFANQYMLSLNSSIGLWRWIEFYNDVAFLKNRKEPLFFGYENGIRFNFIHNIFEIYFPLYSNNGWEISQEAYPQKIRFTFTGDLGAIFNFFRRGFF
ncbi:M1 family metallopeptidase [Polaribacter aestuariivivens]|uniref:M1 family metallopeptidase n=1 Tax=Polaribacter aestuariivivens TaxID=2304626 RepID=A0A5S3NA40_9FLAO|nr:M1 family metallopeptidase [Polaribacter aestuariivivens]TMM31962.1 M1 family metallopeptidase [Polaribacter aestuariivivens]